MTTSPGPRRTIATIARVAFLLSLVVGVVLAAVVVWGVLEARQQDAASSPDGELVGLHGQVAMDEGWERTVYVDGASLPTARCEVTGPDGTVQTLEGYDPVGTHAFDGKRTLGDVRAQTAGEHTVGCTGVEQAWVSDQFDPGRRALMAIPGLAGLFLLAAVVPTALISLVVWLVARGGARPVSGRR